MIKRILAAGACILALGGPLAARADMGPLAGIVEPRSDEVWDVRLDGGAVEMTNRQSPYQITYFFVNPRPGEEGQREISVDVAMLASENDSLAGLLYGFRENPKSYFLFAVGGDRSVNLYHFDQGSFEQRMKLSLSDLRAEKTTLTIRERGDEIALLVNGVEKSSIGGDAFGRGAVGIAAGHIGRYRFDNFRVATGRTGAAEPQRPASTATAARPSVQANAAPLAAGGRLHVKPIQVVDRGGPFGPMPVFSTVAPVDWVEEGGVTWSPPNACKQGPQLAWGVKSPDERYGIGFLPTITWGVSNSGVNVGCVRQNLPDAEAVLRFYLAQGAAQGSRYRIVDVQRPPMLQQIARQAAQQMQAGLAAGQGGADAILAIAKAEENGRRSDVAFIVVTTHYQMQQPDGLGGMFQLAGGAVERIIAVATPEGELDRGHPAFPVIMNNFRANPQWNQAVATWWARQRRSQNQSFAAANARIVENNSSIGDIIHQGYRSRSGLTDRGQAESVEAVWGVETYASPDGDVAFSTAYDQAWRLDDGSYVLTNDAFFNPDRIMGQGGAQLRPNR